MQKPDAKLIFRDPIHFLAFGFGAGLAPKAPGTAGTLVAIPIAYALSLLGLEGYLLLTLLISLTGIYICGRSATKLGQHDYGGIVWDEIAGYLIAVAGFAHHIEYLVLGFLLFRFFDIVKPPPIVWLDQKIHGGLGIMLDDIVAGIMSWLCLSGTIYVLNS